MDQLWFVASLWDISGRSYRDISSPFPKSPPCGGSKVGATVHRDVMAEELVPLTVRGNWKRKAVTLLSLLPIQTALLGSLSWKMREEREGPGLVCNTE